MAAEMMGWRGGQGSDKVVWRGSEVETFLPGGLAVEPSPREVRSSRRLEEGPRPTHNRLIAPATRKY